jgi:hypothetical protein
MTSTPAAVAADTMITTGRRSPDGALEAPFQHLFGHFRAATMRASA